MSTTPWNSWKGKRKVFQDAVHGSIILPDILVKIIDTPEFQRMRNIRQLGIARYVYPTGGHSRFEHSIGVAYLAGEMLKSLRSNSDPEIMEKVTHEETLCVMIAGLCHDLGHGPFSHTWEQFRALAAINKEEEDKVHHEDLSVGLFQHILKTREKVKMEFLKNNLHDREQKLIVEMIKGEGTLLDEQKQFLYSIVANSTTGVDVDKWDYFLRDSLSLGFKVSFDYRRLLHLTRVEKKDGVPVISYRDREKINLEDMFRVRADLHVRAYQHPVVQCIEAMLLDALLEADKKNWKININGDEILLSDAHKKWDHYVMLGDFIVNVIQCSKDDKSKIARAILMRIELRDLYQDLGSWQTENEWPSIDRRILLTSIRQKLNEKHDVNVFLTLTIVNNGKDKNPVELVNFYERDGSRKRVCLFPHIKYDLPFIAVRAFCREHIEADKKAKVTDDILELLKDHNIKVK